MFPYFSYFNFFFDLRTVLISFSYQTTFKKKIHLHKSIFLLAWKNKCHYFFHFTFLIYIFYRGPLPQNFPTLNPKTTSPVCHDFPAFFVRPPPISFGQKPSLFPFMCTYSPSKHMLRFSWFSTRFRRVPSHQFESKTITFPLHRHISPFINTSCCFRNLPFFL